MSVSRDVILSKIAAIADAATSGSVDALDRVRNARSDLLSTPGLRAATLTPFSVCDSNVLRYSITLEQNENTFFGILCPDPTNLILFSERDQSFRSMSDSARIVAPAALDTPYIEIAADSPFRPLEHIYVELWQNGARCLELKTGYIALVAQCS